MEYKVGQKFQHKVNKIRKGTIVHIHDHYCLMAFAETADLYTMTDMDVLFEPCRDPIDGAAICWVEATEPSDSDNPIMGWFGIADIAKTQCRRCNTKVRITVEEIEENS